MCPRKRDGGAFFVELINNNTSSRPYFVTIATMLYTSLVTYFVENKPRKSSKRRVTFILGRTWVGRSSRKLYWWKTN